MDVSNKVVVIAGGASGLGAACAYQLSLAGAKVAILDRQEVAAEKIAKEVRGKAFECDVTDSPRVEEIFRRVAHDLGDIRVVINCAGIAPAKRLVGKNGPMPTEEFVQAININLVGTFNIMREAAAHMTALSWSDKNESCGVIINTASVAAYEGQIGQIAYSASKAGVVGMTLPAARELARFGIRVMTIAPGIFETPMMVGMTSEVQASLAQQVPFPKRLGKPQEYAQLVQQIIENEMLNGSVIRLDGAIRMAAT